MGEGPTKLIAARIALPLADWIHEAALRNFRNDSQQIEFMLTLAKTIIENQPLPPDPLNSVREALGSYHAKTKPR